MNYDDWRNQLAPYLKHWENDAEVRWSDLTTQLHARDVVSGSVIAKAHFGAWIDIQVGFPALLELPYIRGLTPERYRTDEWCPLGSVVTARVLGFAPSNTIPQIRLAQVRQIYSTISSEERERLTLLTEGIKSLNEAIARLGQPSRGLPEGLISFEPASGIKQSYRVLAYENISDSARVFVTDRGKALPEFEFRTKHLGQEEYE